MLAAGGRSVFYAEAFCVGAQNFATLCIDFIQNKHAFALHILRKLGAEEFEGFIQSYSRPPEKGIRVNTLKISAAEFRKITLFKIVVVEFYARAGALLLIAFPLPFVALKPLRQRADYIVIFYFARFLTT